MSIYIHHPLTKNGRERPNGPKAAELRAKGYTWPEICRALPRSTGQRFTERAMTRAVKDYLKGRADAENQPQAGNQASRVSR